MFKLKHKMPPRVENRKLTEKEFYNLLDNSDDGQSIKEYDNSYDLFDKSIKSFGIVINNIPIYAGCVIDSPIGKTTESMLRNGCREKYAFTLYKIVKKKAQEWAACFGVLRCYMYLDGSEESNLVFNWIKKMGYSVEGFVDNRYVMALYAK